MKPAKQNVFTGEEKEGNVCLSSTESQESEGKEEQAGLRSEGRNLPPAC